jgi:hypothetical protein
MMEWMSESNEINSGSMRKQEERGLPVPALQETSLGYTLVQVEWEASRSAADIAVIGCTHERRRGALEISRIGCKGKDTVKTFLTNSAREWCK